MSLMKFLIIVAIAFVLLIPLSVFAQDRSRNIMEDYCQANWKDDLVGCADYIVDGNFIKQQKEIPQNQSSDDSSELDKTSPKPSELDKTYPKSSDIIKFSDDSIPMILLAGLSIIGIIGFITFKLVGRYDLKKDRKSEQDKIKHLDGERIAKETLIKFEENQRLKKIKEEDEQREAEDRLEDSVSIRIFYDLEKKNAKYWKETDMLDRIRIKDKEIREEIKIKQNKITLRISVESGGKHKFAKLISGGAVDFWDHDIGGYTLQVHLSKPEEFLKLIIIKHIRRSNPDMVIHDSSHSITAILVRQDADYRDASNILNRIIEKSCDELTEIGDVLVE